MKANIGAPRARASIFACSAIALGAAACATSSSLSQPRSAPQPTTEDLAAARARALELQPVIDALVAGDLPRAERTCPGYRSPEGRALCAWVRWLVAQRDLTQDIRTALVQGAMRSVNERHLFAALDRALEALSTVEADLSAAEDGDFTLLPLCPSCWRIDADGDGAITAGDQLLLEVEHDALGRPLPEGDARRRPTFHFDRGDLAWARAMVAYQRAALSALRAYHWGDLEPALRSQDDTQVVIIRLEDAGRVRRAAELIGEGIDHARRARAEYLAEVDDDLEWVPNPDQRSHGVPLVVDAALYQTWLAILDDSARLLSGEEGVDLSALASLTDPALGPRVHGFLDVHEMFTNPGPIRLDLRALNNANDDPQGAVRALLGGSWRASMRPSGLHARAARMQSEVQAGLEPWMRKLRYLIWLN